MAQPKAHTVLVVDDDEGIRMMLTTACKQAGFRVVQAADGAKALALARKQKPDLILLDVMMPGTDGRDVCRAIRADPKLDGVAIILITGRVDPSDRRTGLDAGADDYIEKPIIIDLLMHRIEHLIWKRTQGER